MEVSFLLSLSEQILDSDLAMFPIKRMNTLLVDQVCVPEPENPIRFNTEVHMYYP